MRARYLAVHARKINPKRQELTLTRVSPGYPPENTGGKPGKNEEGDWSPTRFIGHDPRGYRPSPSLRIRAGGKIIEDESSLDVTDTLLGDIVI